MKPRTYLFPGMENNWRAGGAAIFGGYGHQIHHCVIKDGVAGSGIRFTNDFSGFTFDNTHTPIRVYENTITACGTSYDIWNQKRGAIEFYANTGIFNLQFDNNDINNSQRDGVQLFGNNISNLVFNNTHINGTGLDTVTRNVPQDIYGGFGIYCQANSQTCTFNKLTVTNAESGTFINRNTSFQLIITDVTVPVTGVSISPAGDTTVGLGQIIQLGAVITRSCALANYLETRISAEPRLELLAPVQLNIVCFRYRGADADALNAAIVADIHESGIAAPSTTTIGGHLAIRAAIVNHRTDDCDIDALLDAVLHCGAARVDGQSISLAPSEEQAELFPATRLDTPAYS